MIKRCILWPLIRVWISGGITESLLFLKHLFLDKNQYVQRWSTAYNRLHRLIQ